MTGGSDALVGVISFESVNQGPWNVHAFGLVRLMRDLFDASTLTIEPPRGPLSVPLTDAGRRLDLVGRLPGRARTVPTVRDVGPLDLLFVVAHDMADLERLYLSRADWDDGGATKVLVIVEAWPGDAERFPDCFARVLPRFDRVFTCLESGRDALEAAAGVPVSVLAQSVDVLTTPTGPPRCDLLSFGRRAPVQHDLFLRWAREHSGWYRYDTLPLPDELGIWTHRRSMANTAVTVCNYARFDNPDRCGGSRVVGTRFWEVAASGSIPLGAAPTEAMWQREFGDLPAYVELDLDADDLTIVDRAVELGRDPGIRARMRAFALERCDHAHRLAELLDAIGLPRPGQLDARLRALADEREDVLGAIDPTVVDLRSNDRLSTS